jgi:leucyl/phenylalanyl-tRNA---protein transferase
MQFPPSYIKFPAVESANEDGLLAVGGDLSPGTLVNAYRHGIFPWYNEGEPILWWSPNPRFVLFPGKIKVSKSMRALLNKDKFRFTVNKAFPEVIKACKTAPRKDQHGTWISPAVQEAYIRLHEMGYAHSAEAWQDEKLAGGLYGVRLGNVFFGESMFSNESNASKFAFIKYIAQLETEHVALIDCQVYTPHLESLGAEMIERKTFISLLKKLIP